MTPSRNSRGRGLLVVAALAFVVLTAMGCDSNGRRSHLADHVNGLCQHVENALSLVSTDYHDPDRRRELEAMAEDVRMDRRRLLPPSLTSFEAASQLEREVAFCTLARKADQDQLSALLYEPAEARWAWSLLAGDDFKKAQASADGLLLLMKKVNALPLDED